MSDLILTHEQEKLLAEASAPIAVRNPDGRLLGYVSPVEAQSRPPGFTTEQIAEAERRLDSAGPWYTTQQVLEHLRLLDAHD